MNTIRWITIACFAWSGVISGAENETGADESDSVVVEILKPAPQEEQRPLSSGFTDAKATLAVLPEYPKGGLRRKIDGTVTVEFDITKHGRAENMKVVEELPRGVFDDVAVDALKYWAFSPARLDSCGTAEQRGRQTFEFRHDGDPQIRIKPLVVNEIPQLPRPTRKTTLKEHRSIQAAEKSATVATDPRQAIATHRVDPEYPEKALDRRKEGMVALSFLIEKDGSVSEIEVVDTVNGYLFKRPALQAMRQWEFKPRLKNGKPVEYVACHEFVFHIDEYVRSGKLARQREKENIRTFSPN